MWIVRLALSRPYTFIVMAMVVLLLTGVALTSTPTDIFPDINIPVISLVWNYTGLQPQEMEQRITSNSERAVTTLVNDVEHIESQSLNGISVVKIYFQPKANIQTALAQTTAIVQTILRTMPPGTTPPLVAIYSASTVPVIQIGMTSDSLSEQALFDFGNNFIRTQLATVQGAALPYPYGGKQRLDLCRSRYRRAAIPGPFRQRYRQCGGRAKSYSAYWHGQTRLPGIFGGVERQPAKRGRLERSADQDRQRRHRVHARCRAHPRRFLPANQLVRANGQRGVLMSVYKTGSPPHWISSAASRKPFRTIPAPFRKAFTSPCCSTSHFSCALPFMECCVKR